MRRINLHLSCKCTLTARGTDAIWIGLPRVVCGSRAAFCQLLLILKNTGLQILCQFFFFCHWTNPQISIQDDIKIT